MMKLLKVRNPNRLHRLFSFLPKPFPKLSLSSNLLSSTLLHNPSTHFTHLSFLHFQCLFIITIIIITVNYFLLGKLVHLQRPRHLLLSQLHQHYRPLKILRIAIQFSLATDRSNPYHFFYFLV